VTPTELVNAVLTRLGISPSKTAHKSYHKYAAGIGCEILHREVDGKDCLEAVWSLRLNRESAALNATRAEEVYRQILGLKFIVPATPTATFFDDVARGAKWVRDSVDPSKIV
jgi:hypothetical protein